MTAFTSTTNLTGSLLSVAVRPSLTTALKTRLFFTALATIFSHARLHSIMRAVF